MCFLLKNPCLRFKAKATLLEMKKKVQSVVSPACYSVAVVPPLFSIFSLALAEKA